MANTVSLTLLLGTLSLLQCASGAHLSDVNLLNFALNLEYLEATFYSFAAYGTGLSSADRGGGPAPTGSGVGALGTLSPEVKAIAVRIAKDEINHVRFLRAALGSAAVPAPVINVGSAFAATINAALGKTLSPAFSPYKADIVFLLGAFIFEDVGVTAYKGAAPLLDNKDFLEAAAGILATEAYHGGVIRSALYQKISEVVFPYAATVNFLSTAISNLRKKVSGADDDQAVLVRNAIVLAPADIDGIAYSRTYEQVLAIVYLSGNPNITGGFFPNGMTGVLRTDLK